MGGAGPGMNVDMVNEASPSKIDVDMVNESSSSDIPPHRQLHGQSDTGSIQGSGLETQQPDAAEVTQQLIVGGDSDSGASVAISDSLDGCPMDTVDGSQSTGDTGELLMSNSYR